MKVYKYCYTLRMHRPHKIPDEWHCPTYQNHFSTMLEKFDERINCASCGAEVRFGSSFDSYELVNENSERLNVCRECHNKEIKRRKKHDNGRGYVF